MAGFCMEAIEKTLNGNLPAFFQLGVFIIVEIPQIFLGDETVENGAKDPLPMGAGLWMA